MAQLMLIAVYTNPERPACNTCFRFIPNPRATTDACSNNLASELLSARKGCSTANPNTMPPTNAIAGDTTPLAASMSARKKIVLFRVMG